MDVIYFIDLTLRYKAMLSAYRVRIAGENLFLARAANYSLEDFTHEFYLQYEDEDLYYAEIKKIIIPVGFDAPTFVRSLNLWKASPSLTNSQKTWLHEAITGKREKTYNSHC